MAKTPPYVHWPPGLRRLPDGNWLDADDGALGAADLERVKALAIPPAWQHVWVATDPTARVQARGIDSRGRVQYRYSAEATEAAARNKFEHALHYAEQLPQLRARVLHQLARRPPAPDIDQVTALAVRFLNLGLFRVGTQRYVDDNHTYGLTTLERRHVQVSEPVVTFDFVGKEHLRQAHDVLDQPAARVTKKLLAARPETPNTPLFAAGDPERRIDSATVNTFIHAVSGSAASAKVARTWGATVIAAAVAAGARFESPHQHRDPTLTAFDAASHVLGNTPTMARNSYVHPSALSLADSADVRAALQRGAERLGTDEATRVFVDEELQSVVAAELRARSC